MKRYERRYLCCTKPSLGRLLHLQYCPRAYRLHFVHQRPSWMPVRRFMGRTR